MKENAKCVDTSEMIHTSIETGLKFGDSLRTLVHLCDVCQYNGLKVN